MAVGDGWTSRLIGGLAELLDTANIGVWRPDGPAYAADEVGILDRVIPSTPDRVITLAVYPVGAGVLGLADVTVGLQARIRGTTDPRVCGDIADAVYDLWHGASNLTVGGISVVQIYRPSYSPLTQDANQRWETSHNYYVEAMRPTSNNPD